ncbi:MAG: VOC family protein, partial [Dehalococcoidia bacterium]
MSRYFGELAHVGIVVRDIRQAMAELAATGVGPIYLMNQIAVPARYRGVRHDVRLSVAFAYSGPFLLEYIEQHDDAPSSYRDLLARSPEGGVHHMAYFSDDFAGTIAAATEKGARVSVVQEFFDEATGESYEIYLESLDTPTAPAIQ